MLFDTLADTYLRLEETTKRLEMTDILAKLLQQCDGEEIAMVVYLTQGKIHPDWKAQPELGMAERMVVETVAQVTGLKKSQVEALLRETGDVGLAAEEALKRKTQVGFASRRLTVAQVYQGLDEIARLSGPGSSKQKVAKLGRLLVSTSPLGARYICRMVEGKLRLGVGDMTILDALSLAYTGSTKNRPILERAFNLSSDLGAVAKTLVEEGLEGVKAFKARVGYPIRVMSAQRLSTAEEIIEKLGGHCSAEFKLDGERVQIHRRGGEVQLYSRRLENITHMYPDVVEQALSHLGSQEAIVEGEVVAYNPDTGENLPFQTLMQRRRKYNVRETMQRIPAKVYLFDCLFDGGDLTLEPYPVRVAHLEAMVEPTETFQLVRRLETSDPQELDRFFHLAISEGCEGLVVKSTAPESIYRAGARSWLWVKLKRSYQSKMQDTVDLVVVGALYGKGRRAGVYGALLVAAYDPESDTYPSVCKVGSGFTDQDLAEMVDLLEPYRASEKPHNVDTLVEADVWFTPAMVMEVLGDELTLSPLHKAAFGVLREDSGLAIRFPRFTRWRDDKSADEATTVEELVEMYRAQLKTL